MSVKTTQADGQVGSRKNKRLVSHQSLTADIKEDKSFLSPNFPITCTIAKTKRADSNQMNKLHYPQLYRIHYAKTQRAQASRSAGEQVVLQVGLVGSSSPSYVPIFLSSDVSYFRQV